LPEKNKMYCGNCGNEVAEQAIICLRCGVQPKNGTNHCQKCGTETNPDAEVCLKCGVKLAILPDETGKSIIVAGVLGVFSGGFGIHRFYLGYPTIGIIQIVVTLITLGLGGLWGPIEGIMILAGGWSKDAQGRPLRE
jgi:TM2 domain-containing membrane protein YozV/ribosomal protein L40E